MKATSGGDRSAAVSGGARTGAGQESAGRGQPEECATRPRTLSALAKKDYATQQQLDTQQAKVDQLTAQIQGDQAAIDNAQTQLSYTTISLPCPARPASAWSIPATSCTRHDQTGIVTIVKLQPISVVFTAPEENVPQINRALAAGTVPGGWR